MTPAADDWCLFLDRDGVINRRVEDDYVRTWKQFVFNEGALEAISSLSRVAPKVVIVTNQQGVGKDLMTQSDLDEIHEQMIREIAIAGGRIDAVLTCTHLAAELCACRKPAPGLALEWLSKNPQIDGARSVMVGDSNSDIEMGIRLATALGGCTTISIGSDVTVKSDFSFPSLKSMSTNTSWSRRAVD